MKKGIKVIRKIKSNLIRMKFHIIFDPFSTPLITMAYLSKLSKWVRKASSPGFNDFYTRHHDYNKRYELYNHVVQSENLSSIYYIEFGVAEGQSFKWWVNNIKSEDSRFAGFDTFTGLPEDWGYFKKGEMSAHNSFPDVSKDERCQFFRGFFQETVPSFLKGFNTNLRKVIHMDADIYTSTLFALSMIGPYLNKDDILIFDEFNVPMHEFKAFTEFAASFYVKVRLLGAVNNYYQVAFKIEENLSCLNNN
ncbi:MAG: class I SAM-dependent methyltransferase [Bacteroidales bacterium]